MASGYTEEQIDFPIQGTGLHWEADAVARCIRGELFLVAQSGRAADANI
jgi:hypothetical protein